MAVSLGSGLEKAPGSIVFELGRRLEVVPVGTMQAILRGLGLRWPGLKDNTWGKRTERGWREAATLVGADTFTVKSPYDSTERPAKFYALVVPETLDRLRARARQTDEPLSNLRDPFAVKKPAPTSAPMVLPPADGVVLPEPVAPVADSKPPWMMLGGIALLAGAGYLYYRQQAGNR
jgi:hypothetical protein